VFSIFAVKSGAKQVYSFEPDNVNYQTFLEFTRVFDNIKSFNLAVTKPGLSQLHIKGMGCQCQVSENGDGDLVNCICLEEILREISGDNLIMKLDCEGSEYDIIFTCSQDLLRRFKYMYTEIHEEVHPNKSYNVVMFKKFMNNIGFSSQYTTPAAGIWYGDTFVPYPMQVNQNIKFTRID
jgi:FkbM family methyltransferase